jgi:DNA-3-methyladenine glycosylase I
VTNRCQWAGEDALMVAYHDEEWGVPEHDDRRLFELLTLEGAQAGLSWMTVLRKRDRYRRVFAAFDPVCVARFGPDDVDRLLADAGIIRNRAKVESTITNAAAIASIQEERGSFAEFLWDFVGGVPVQNRWRELTELPTQTDLSKTLSREFKRHGFRFVGPTTVYAFLQAAGFVNDHVVDCFRWRELTASSPP